MWKTRRAWTVCAVALVVPMAACGGGDTGPTVVATPTPTPLPSTAVISQFIFPAVAPGDGALRDVSIPDAGTVRVTLDWTFPTNDVDLFVLSGTTCTAFEGFFVKPPTPGCAVLGQDIDPARKPAVVTFSVTAPQSARILFVNFGSSTESTVTQVTLTR